ncbi:YeeE/YedE family protein [Asticcacaulis benevestitus]|uniref:Uncharacterized protein n=1 Tax=Asticcacaulis benevestitus DSM 16100 = ATCC BAA-896 TaxID=1121022 RepID=V4PUC9_9CAUL|nr:YeeE/YedE thiosulfate transporter family protein [Asticcacaulis benevestitus]ESQ90989.1 hypothetical protein ABENE_11095 [Asticcacaulis benevestitus DSM 16100 = ATCC BAA-896]
MAFDTSAALYALEGGALIGLAAGGLYLTTGRIAGISGIFGDSFLRTPQAWRWLFVAGLVLAGLGARLLRYPLPEAIGSPTGLLVISGLLVGFGTRLGNGCTSGHGVCGLARLSVRSLVAVVIFMATAGLTVWIVRHGGGA